MVADLVAPLPVSATWRPLSGPRPAPAMHLVSRRVGKALGDLVAAAERAVWLGQGVELRGLNLKLGLVLSNCLLPHHYDKLSDAVQCRSASCTRWPVCERHPDFLAVLDHVFQPLLFKFMIITLVPSRLHRSACDTNRSDPIGADLKCGISVGGQLASVRMNANDSLSICWWGSDQR